MAGDYIRQYTGLLTDWSIASFVGASLDWLFSRIDTESHIVNVLGAILQFTFATFLVHELVYALGLRRPTNTIQNSWIMYLAVWQMSPRAVGKLTSAYYSFHRILYGPESEPVQQTDTNTTVTTDQ